MNSLDKVKNPRHGLKKLERESRRWAYKSGVDTPIANKHFYHFQARFAEENAQVLKEAREEMERIRKKRMAIKLKRLGKYRMPL